MSNANSQQVFASNHRQHSHATQAGTAESYILAGNETVSLSLLVQMDAVDKDDSPCGGDVPLGYHCRGIVSLGCQFAGYHLYNPFIDTCSGY